MTGSTAIRPETSGFIAELHGLRGLALALVVGFHVFTDRVSGGIDIFLFITGFLITRILVGQLERGTFAVTSFFSRLANRLWPPIILTLVVVALATWLWLPQVRWPGTAGDLIASLLYYENWRLIGENHAYGSVDGGISPVQHFWSLAVQGQFYLIWLVVICGAVWCGRRLGVSVRTSALTAAGTVVALSFSYATYMVEVDQQVAYLSTFTRLWELALGGVLALVMARVGGRRLPERARWALGGIGLVLVSTCGFALDAAQTFPGYQAIWPLLGAACVLVAGTTGAALSADRLLRSKPFTHIADISFALYLWHWPILVLAVETRGPDKLSIADQTLVIAVSYAFAYASTRFIQLVMREQPSPQPIRSRSGVRVDRLVPVTCVVVLTLTGLLVWQNHLRSLMSPEPIALGNPQYPGAEAEPVISSDSYQIRPTPLEAANERRLYGGPACVTPPGERSENPAAVKVCGFATPAAHATRTIALVGASHVGQWRIPFIHAARDHRWRVIALQKNACQFMYRRHVNTACARWNRNAMRTLRDLRPDLVVSLATSNSWKNQERTPHGFLHHWRTLRAQGIPVLALRDTPRFPQDGAVCLDEYAADPAQCAAKRSASLKRVSPFLQREAVPANVHYADFTDRFCNDTVCPAVIGNVMVMRDDNHMTNLYSRTMTPYIERAIATVPRFGALWNHENVELRAGTTSPRPSASADETADNA